MSKQKDGDKEVKDASQNEETEKTAAEENKTEENKESEKTSKTPETSKDSNIVFVGEDGNEVTGYMNGRIKVELPDLETQKNGFYHERAGEIIRVFGTANYKYLKPKGRK